MTLDELNALSGDQAIATLTDCCGSRRWAELLAGARPFGDVDALVAAAAGAAPALTDADWREAFAQHPRIGAGTVSGSDRHARWSSGEQSAVATADTAVLDRLAEANRRYEERFGRVFLVRAAGRSPEEMLGLLEQRLGNDEATELAISQGQQREIVAIRLRKLIAEPA
jgi:2-oxo-4-hydroxy-4-carboxy-5-ureidoimidazoline decarboxylase